MDHFRKQVKGSLIGYLFGIVACILAVFFATRFRERLIWETHIGFLWGIGTALTGVLLYCTIRSIGALRDQEKLKKLYIRETDERTRLVQQKSGSIGMNIACIGLVLAAAVAGIFNITVFVTLLAAGLFVCVIRGILKIYYFNKY
jgi:hypothetical protein